jgi:hypothetical protein
MLQIRKDVGFAKARIIVRGNLVVSGNSICMDLQWIDDGE